MKNLPQKIKNMNMTSPVILVVLVDVVVLGLV
jgi:hypothetical protein